jgi:hypothetical protein
MATKLSKAPVFSVVRSESGAIAADSATINDTNYPRTKSAQPHGAADKICAYWFADDGTTHATDTVDLQVLLRDGSTGQWVKGQTRYGVEQNQVVEFNVHQCSEVYLRVLAVYFSLAPEDLNIQAATILRS